MASKNGKAKGPKTTEEETHPTTQARIKPVEVHTLKVRIKGLTPLIHHQFAEKARIQIRDKKLGKKTKNREVCDPQAEYEAASYKLSDGSPAIPAIQIKKAMTMAAHKDLGFERSLLRRGLFIRADEGFLCKLNTTGSKMREDVVRVGMGGTDLRYRPEYGTWSVDLTIDFDAELLKPDDIVNLLERAGFGVGLGEWRPEKDGEFGRFEVERGQTMRVTK